MIRGRESAWKRSAVWAGAAAAGCWSGAAPPATVVVVRGVPWWGVILSAAAPVLMVGGWTVAAGLQPHSFDPVTQTVSALAAPGAADRWVMTLTFLVVGACDFATGVALRPARAPGRLILMAGAVAGLLVAANPEQPGTSLPLPQMTPGGRRVHRAGVLAGGAWRRGPSVPWGLRPAVSAGAVAVLLALLAWFGAELIAGAGRPAWPSASSARRRRCGPWRWSRPAVVPPSGPAGVQDSAHAGTTRGAAGGGRLSGRHLSRCSRIRGGTWP